MVPETEKYGCVLSVACVLIAIGIIWLLGAWGFIAAGVAIVVLVLVNYYIAERRRWGRG
jgi:hypothetical protein